MNEHHMYESSSCNKADKESLCVCEIVSHRSHAKEAGLVLALGQGDVGQLGQGEDVIERKKPGLVSLPEKIVQVVAGGMHTVCVSDTGNVRTICPGALLTLCHCVSRFSR